MIFHSFVDVYVCPSEFQNWIYIYIYIFWSWLKLFPETSLWLAKGVKNQLIEHLSRDHPNNKRLRFSFQIFQPPHPTKRCRPFVPLRPLRLVRPGNRWFFKNMAEGRRVWGGCFVVFKLAKPFKVQTSSQWKRFLLCVGMETKYPFLSSRQWQDVLVSYSSNSTATKQLPVEARHPALPSPSCFVHLLSLHFFVFHQQQHFPRPSEPPIHARNCESSSALNIDNGLKTMFIWQSLRFSRRNSSSPVKVLLVNHAAQRKPRSKDRPPRRKWSTRPGGKTPSVSLWLWNGFSLSVVVLSLFLEGYQDTQRNAFWLVLCT